MTKENEQGVKLSKEALPMYTVLFTQFGEAIKHVVKRSQEGHKKYIETDGDWLNFKRVPDAYNEYSNAMFRHAMNIGSDTELDHHVATAWNALARLQIYLENNDIKIK